MGCDIHAHIEHIEQDCNDEQWFVWASLNLSRRYDAFGLMAGVRGDRQMFQPKGMPDYLSDSAQDEWRHGGHTPSWLNRNELASVSINLDQSWDELTIILHAMEMLEMRGHVSRLVFWFDS